MTEPTLLLITTIVAGISLIMLPGPVGAAACAAIAASAVLAEHIIGESVSHLPVRVGPESLIGLTALAVDDLQPSGRVRCAGDLWRAVEVGGRKVPSGRPVKVIALRGLTLFVQGREETEAGS